MEEAVQVGSGTGFFISNDGIIVTCAHVIEVSDIITVKVNNTEYRAEILAKDSNTDLAILKINYKSSYYFKVSNFNRTNLGDKVYVLGFPLSNLLGSDIRITDGVISAKTGFNSEQLYFQLSAPIQPGNSGGPIINDRFEVIGVAAAILDESFAYNASGALPQNVNFGVKSGYINPLLDTIKLKNGGIKTLNDASKATVQILCKNINYSYKDTRLLFSYLKGSFVIQNDSNFDYAILRMRNLITLTQKDLFYIRLVDYGDFSTPTSYKIYSNEESEDTFVFILEHAPAMEIIIILDVSSIEFQQMISGNILEQVSKFRNSDSILEISDYGIANLSLINDVIDNKASIWYPNNSDR
ncbi:hypothetical protein FACS1894142_6060 [Spirochaetia bacterium]|nr:hypothetical protein FACS1894142_6060 [Spirochaetia bacterium]